MLITVTCNECGAEFDVPRDDDRVKFGRLYCSEHSVLKNQQLTPAEIRWEKSTREGEAEMQEGKRR